MVGRFVINDFKTTLSHKSEKLIQIL